MDSRTRLPSWKGDAGCQSTRVGLALILVLSRSQKRVFYRIWGGRKPYWGPWFNRSVTICRQPKSPASVTYSLSLTGDWRSRNVLWYTYDCWGWLVLRTRLTPLAVGMPGLRPFRFCPGL